MWVPSNCQESLTPKLKQWEMIFRKNTTGWPLKSTPNGKPSNAKLSLIQNTPSILLFTKLQCVQKRVDEMNEDLWRPNFKIVDIIVEIEVTKA